eukprot:860675-Pelagomonas_calceolata.AAC.1
MRMRSSCARMLAHWWLRPDFWPMVRSFNPVVLSLVTRESVLLKLGQSCLTYAKKRTFQSVTCPLCAKGPASAFHFQSDSLQLKPGGLTAQPAGLCRTHKKIHEIRNEGIQGLGLQGGWPTA